MKIFWRFVQPSFEFSNSFLRSAFTFHCKHSRTRYLIKLSFQKSFHVFAPQPDQVTSRRFSATMQLRQEFNVNLFVLSSLMIATLKVQCQTSTGNVLTRSAMNLHAKCECSLASSCYNLSHEITHSSNFPFDDSLHKFDRRNWCELALFINRLSCPSFSLLNN